MTLALEATNAVPPVQGVGLTCHIATRYWAAREAQALGRSTAKTPLQTLMNISGIPLGRRRR